MQVSTNILVDLFKQAGLLTNTDKTKCVTFVPGKIRTRLSDRVYRNSQEGLMSEDAW